MDTEVCTELETIMKMQDEEPRRRAAERLIQYILSLPTIPSAYTPILLRFSSFAFSILPSSSLPATLAQRFSLPVSRRRRVSFGPTDVFHMKAAAPMSQEAEKQRIREESTLSLTNTDPHKKFKPKNAFEPCLPNSTQTVPLFDGTAAGPWTGKIARVGKTVPRLNIDLSKIIENPLLLDEILSRGNISS